MSKWYEKLKPPIPPFIENFVNDLLPNWIPGLGYNAPSNRAYKDRNNYEEYQKEQNVALVFPWLAQIYRARDQQKYWDDYFKNRDGVNPNDVKYPWLKMGDTVSGTGFGVAYSTINFVSDNVKRLYR